MRYEYSLIHYRYVGILILGALLIAFDRVLILILRYAHVIYAHDYVDQSLQQRP